MKSRFISKKVHAGITVREVELWAGYFLETFIPLMYFYLSPPLLSGSGKTGHFEAAVPRD
jgi:hypothetical protein